MKEFPLPTMHYDDFLSLLRERRSIRYFSNKAVDRAMLEKILSAGTLAPSVENTQPWTFHVIMNKDLKAKMMEHSCYGNFVAGAAAFVVVTCDRSTQRMAKDTIWNPRELEYSCIAAMQNMMLAAATMGIGSCWVSLHHGPVHNLLKLPDYHVVVGGMMLGYLKDGEKMASGEHERKPITKAVSFHD